MWRAIMLGDVVLGVLYLILLTGSGGFDQVWWTVLGFIFIILGLIGLIGGRDVGTRLRTGFRRALASRNGRPPA